MIQVLVSSIYFFTFLAKCNSGWWDGSILAVFQRERSIDHVRGPIIPDWMSFRGLSLFTLAAEGFLAFGFWSRRLRWMALVVGVLLHTGIDLLMDVRTYSLQMFALYIVCMVPVAHAADDRARSPAAAGANEHALPERLLAS